MKKFSLGLSVVMGLTSVAMPALASSAEPTGVYEHRYDPETVTVINSGLAALKARLNMIESAKKTIDMEYFIYSIDQAGRLITQALIRKSKQGVKVRMIIDSSLPIFELNQFYAKVLRENNIEVRYYNPSMILLLIQEQFRSHRKSLIIDGEQGITGGRNIADEYFDLASDYNFMDSDMYVRGPIVKDMHTSFEEFWNAKITHEAKDPFSSSNDDSVFQWKMRKARDYATQNQKDRDLLKQVNSLGGKLLAEQTTDTCHDMIFAADFPGIGEKTRVLQYQLADEAALARKSIFIESPYFVIKHKISSVLDDLLARHVSVNVLTNSLYSTDAFYTQSAFDTRIGLWTSQGANVWMHDGDRNAQDYPVIDSVEKSRWGTHSKRAVIDGRTAIVGTFNMDPRSTDINAEMALICHDNERIAMAVQNSIQERIHDYGIKLDKFGHVADHSEVHHAVPLTKEALFWLTLPLSNIFDFLL